MTTSLPDDRQRSRLDPHAPLVLDTRELGRRPGSMRSLRRTVPAPPGLGLVDLIGVPPGADLELDLRLESVMEGVLVSGHAEGALAGECGRCLEPVQDRLRVTLQELYVYADKHADRRDASADADDEDEVSRMQGDLLDLEPALRDAVVLALPLTPLCREDCAGLCVDCGERLDDLPEDHAHDTVDARWGALAGLLADDDAPGSPPGSTRTRPTSTPDRSTPEE